MVGLKDHSMLSGLINARDDLLTLRGSDGTRLASVYKSYLYSIRKDDLPDELQDDFRRLKELLTRIDDDRDGSINATTAQMHWKHSQECKEVIMKLANWAEQAMHSLRGSNQ